MNFIKTLHVISDCIKSSLRRVYCVCFAFYARLKETLEVTPSSSQLLFTPANASLIVDKGNSVI